MDIVHKWQCPPHPPILYTFGISFVLTDLGKTYSQKLPQNNMNEPYNYLKTSLKLLE